MFPASFPPKVPSLWRPLPSTGSLQVGSPASLVLLDAPTPCHPSPPASLPSPSNTVPVPDCFAPNLDQTLPILGRGFVSGVPFPALSDGDDRASQVPGEPQYPHAPLLDPGGIPEHVLSSNQDVAFR